MKSVTFYELCYFFPRLAEAEGDEGILKLFDANRACACLIERLEVLSKL